MSVVYFCALDLCLLAVRHVHQNVQTLSRIKYNISLFANIRSRIRFSVMTWPSGLRRKIKALVRKGVGSNPTVITTAHNAFTKRGWISNARLFQKCLQRGIVGDESSLGKSAFDELQTRPQAVQRRSPTVCCKRCTVQQALHVGLCPNRM